MNLRNFKKEIEYNIGDFIEDCALFQTLNPGKAEDKISEIVEDAVDLYNDLKDKANFKVDAAKRAYFFKLRKEMAEKTDELYARLSKIVEENRAEAKA